jgi:Mg2+ and Co2+ transporter CorA
MKINNLKNFLKILTKLIDNYKNLSINSEDDEYFRQISNLALNLKDNLNQYRQKQLRNDL